MVRTGNGREGPVQASFLDVDALGLVASRTTVLPSRVRVGAASWTDPTLLRSGWYPAGASSATARLRHYSGRFDLVEADAPFYAIPVPAVTMAWTSRTPPGFIFNVKTHALLTGHRTRTARLPGPVRALLSADVAGQASVGPADVGPPAMEAVRDAFEESIAPLRKAGRLGVVLFQYPRWFVPGPRANATLASIRQEFPDMPVAVEFRNAAWAIPDVMREVVSRLRDLRLTFVGVDSPHGLSSAMPPVDAVTTRHLAVLRLHGRNAGAWDARHETAATRFRYRYDEVELVGEILPRVRRLAGEANEVHVLFNNCHGDDGVRNAETLTNLLTGPPATGVQSDDPSQRG